MNKYASPLRLVALIVAGVGLVLSEVIQRRETEELIEEVLNRREQEGRNVYNITNAG